MAMTTELAEEHRDTVERWIESAVESQTEYETHHWDAGDAYAHCPGESCCHLYRADEFRDYCERNYIRLPDRIKASDVLAEAYAAGAFDMKPGYWAALPDSDGFTLDSFSVGEVEIQLELETVCRGTGLSEEIVRPILASLDHKLDRSDCFFAYGNAEGHFWACVIPQESLRETITRSIIRQVQQG